MEPYIVEIGAATGFAQGPTVKDMYRVIQQLGEQYHALREQEKVAEPALTPQPDAIHVYKTTIGARGIEWALTDLAITSFRELEHYAENGSRIYFPLDARGIEHRLADDISEPQKAQLRRIPKGAGSSIHFHAYLLNGDLSYHEDLLWTRALGGAGEFFAGIGILCAASYGLVTALARDSSAGVIHPVTIGGALAGIGLAADGMRRFVRSQRRYLRLQIRPLQDDKKTHARAEKLVSLFQG